MQQQPQIFSLTALTGDDIQAIMLGMNELPSKTSRATMNKVESQIVQQVRERQAAELAAASKQKTAEGADDVKPGLNEED